MPNYNYRSGDYMRRSQCPRQMTVTPTRVEREPIAMAFVPWQEWQNLHSAEKALYKGTIFEDLDKPFLRIGGCQK